MGKLNGFKYRDIIRILKLFGFSFYRQAAGSHEIWYNETTKKFTTIPNHSGDMPEGTLRAILKQSDIDVHEFNNIYYGVTIDLLLMYYEFTMDVRWLFY